MRTLARALVGLLLLGSACSGPHGAGVTCEGQTSVSIDEELGILDGESARSRFEAVQKAWDCLVRWLELPPRIGSAEPAPGQSRLELALEATSDRVTLGQRAVETSRGVECRSAYALVPASIRLVSEDGGLDERMSGELLLERHNTLVAFVLDGYEFAGTHSTAFAGGVSVQSVELYLTFFPGVEPTRVDGSLVESGRLDGPGRDPYATTAVFDCSLSAE